MIYKVALNYYYFAFTDRTEALDFAEKARLHTTGDLSVEIILVTDEEADNE